MPGLVPGIHVFFLLAVKAWMAGTDPAMTRLDVHPDRAARGEPGVGRVRDTELAQIPRPQ
jgi:hypothetical protein